MAVLLAITYQKKLGLPNYSSHSCSVSLTVEIPDASAAAHESSKLYQLLQAAVDHEIQHVGYMPDATTYGMANGAAKNGGHPQVNGHQGSNGHTLHNGRANGHSSNGSNGQGLSRDDWNCTEGQRGLILRVVNEGKLDKADVEAMAQQMFGLGVKQLDKMQASQLIEELLEKSGKKSGGQRRWSRQPARS